MCVFNTPTYLHSFILHFYYFTQCLNLLKFVFLSSVIHKYRTIYQRGVLVWVDVGAFSVAWTKVSVITGKPPLSLVNNSKK